MSANAKFPPERFGLITGSVCSPLFAARGLGKGAETLAIKLAREKYFQFYDEVSTWQMEHGILCEELAFSHWVTYIDHEIVHGQFYQKDDCGGSTDAEHIDYGIDFKCPTSLGSWLDYQRFGIDEGQFNQCQMYMHLTGKKLWKIAAFLMETDRMSNNGLIYPVSIDRRMIVVDVPVDVEWQETLSVNAPIVAKMRDAEFDKLVEKWNDL